MSRKIKVIEMVKYLTLLSILFFSKILLAQTTASMPPQTQAFIGSWSGEVIAEKHNIAWIVNRFDDYTFERKINICPLDLEEADETSEKCESIVHIGTWNFYQNYFSYQYTDIEGTQATNKEGDKKITEFYNLVNKDNDCFEYAITSPEKQPWQEYFSKSKIKECVQ